MIFSIIEFLFGFAVGTCAFSWLGYLVGRALD